VAAVATTTAGCDDAGVLGWYFCTFNGGYWDYQQDGTRYCFGGRGRAAPVAASGNPQAHAITLRVSARERSRGKVRRRGGRSMVTGVTHVGTVRLGSRRRALRAYGRGRFASRVSISVGGKDGVGRIDGHMLIRFTRRSSGSICLRLRGQAVGVDGLPFGQATFTSAGGTGRAARLRVRGGATVTIGQPLVRGSLTTQSSRGKRPAAACRRLARAYMG
jgi:hypothetical protein